MNKLGETVLYHDTDSIIFSVKDGEYVPPLGEYLGQLTSELTCKEFGCRKETCTEHYIEEFVSCGPKNYSFKVNIKPDTPINVYTRFCLNTAKSKFSLVSPVAD